MILNDLYTGSRNNAITESRTYKLWESAGHKLVEAQLTVDQINQLFQQVEQGATAAGGNRTLVGKGKDAASAINTAWEDLKTKVQNSGPIKNVDAMYDQAAEQLKQATGGDQGVMKYVQKYRDFAKKHPVAQSLIYSALIAAAGISGAGIGGAAALGLFKLVDKLLQGEKFSSAAYSGAKTGAMAYGASKVADLIKGTGSGSAPQGPNVDDKIAAARARVDAANAKLGIDGSAPNFDVTGSVAQGGVAAVRQQAGNEAMKAVQQALASGTTSQGDLSNIAQSVLEKYSTLQGGPLSVQTAETLGQKIAMQAARSAGALEESKKLTEAQVNLVISTIVARQHKLDEGIMDTIKGAAGKAVDWAQTKGKNLTTKITADKLMQAWKKAGSPMDSLDVASIIQRAGVSSDIIKQVYAGMNIPFPGGAATTPAAAPAATAAAKPAATTPAAAPAATAAAKPAATTPAAKSFAMPQATSTTAGQPSKVTYGKGFEKKPATTTQFPAFGTAGAGGGYATAPAATSVPTTPTLPKPTTAKVTPTAQATAPAAGQPAVKRNPYNPDDLGFGFDVDTGLPLKSQAEKDANIAKADAAEKAAAQKPAVSAAPAAPKAPAAPAAPKAPAAPAAPGTVGTYDTKTGAAKLGGKTMVALKDLPPAAQKRVAAVAEQANRMLENVKTKQDAEAVRLFIDQQFSKHGLLESALPQRKQLMDHVNKVSAIRRRLHARNLLA